MAGYDATAAHDLWEAGFSPLTAAVLCSRGCSTPREAADLLSVDGPLPPPEAMTDLPAAAQRVRQALENGERVAVFGDYDVDGITSTCLLTQFLREQGGDCLFYIPGRMEEGYGLNIPAIDALHQQGVTLLITVDCGITAHREAAYCRELGLDLIITDHHECKDALPDAVAVVDPHRCDEHYPHCDLAGVGVAFKLAAAIAGDQEAVLDRYADLVCLGTVADVMPLTGENRVFVSRGLQQLHTRPRLGLAALMDQCSCAGSPPTASTIGYTLAPRINAAGRLGQVELAVELFLTDDPQRAQYLARELCELNRHRQAVESEIYEQAVTMLRGRPQPAAIVLADERWHQGVVGIVASRLAEEYRCPTFLICLDGEHGKASSRSYGGFNLFAALEALGNHLESYGGHELAAGFTIRRDAIDNFRQAMEQRAAAFRDSADYRCALEIDCMVEPSLLTLQTVAALDQLEPCGAGCPKPVLAMGGLIVDQCSEVGGGRHLRLRLRKGTICLSAIYFSATQARCGIHVGDVVEVAFTPQINEYRGVRSVQLNVVDIRPMTADTQQSYEQALYERCLAGFVSPPEADWFLPQRPDFVALWRYLSAQTGEICDECGALREKLSRYAGVPASMIRMKLCLDVFAEQGLIALEHRAQRLSITLTAQGRKVDLEESRILRRLKEKKAGD